MPLLFASLFVHVVFHKTAVLRNAVFYPADVSNAHFFKIIQSSTRKFENLSEANEGKFESITWSGSFSVLMSVNFLITTAISLSPVLPWFHLVWHVFWHIECNSV